MKATASSASFKVISCSLKDKLLRPRLAFFLSLAEDLEPFLKEFQSDSPMSPFLRGNLLNILKTCMERVVKDDILGSTLLQKDCSTCLKNVVDKILERSPLKTEALTFLNPCKIGFNQDEAVQQMTSAMDILVTSNLIPASVAQNADREYKKHVSQEKVKLTLKAYLRETRLDDFWMSLLSNQRAKNLMKVVRMLLLFSHGNATLERGFSVNGEEDGEPQIQKVDMSAEHTDVAQRIVFTLDGTRVILANTSGSIKILNLLEDHIERVISFDPYVDKLLKGPVKLLAVSGDGRYLVAGDKHANIVVWSLTNLQYHLSLPKHRCSPTALAIQSSTNNLVVVYADHKDLPLAESKIPRLESSGMSDGVDSSNQGYPRTSSPQHAFHFIKKYKHLVHLEWLVGEELVAVEVSPASLAEKLPPSLKQKKYGM
uniref:Uncharacterized protein n=1 Tax=Timema douglasi TaxID=61478 RepID=A0A7R8VPF1_TIMDO|nr:unnamed protein product [Timema douglasi]